MPRFLVSRSLMYPVRALCAPFLFLLAPAVFAAQTPPAGAVAPAPPTASPAPSGDSSPAGTMRLDVNVTDKSGNPIPDLQAGDFTLLDNGRPAPILSFHAYDSGTQPTYDSPVHILLVIDTMNDPFDDVSYERAQVQKFLRMNGGHLPYPVSVGWVTEHGIKSQGDPTLDGNALADDLTGVEGRLRSTIPSQGVYGDLDRFRISLQILHDLARVEGAKPGRKLIVWIGSGWPMLGGPQYVMPKKDSEQIFAGIVETSALLRRTRISLASVSEGQATNATYFYQEFLKGVHHPEDASLADLSLQVLSVQTGGLVQMPTNDIADSIAACIRGAGSFYTLTFTPPPPAAANEYHKLELHLANHKGATVRTTTGYYAQPPAQAQDHPPSQP